MAATDRAFRGHNPKVLLDQVIQDGLCYFLSQRFCLCIIYKVPHVGQTKGNAQIPTMIRLSHTFDSLGTTMCLRLMAIASVVMLSISRSTVDCNSTTFRPPRFLSGVQLYLAKTFTVYCNLLCYANRSRLLLILL